MKKFTTKKRKINSKKGFSMVLAIALVAVLFLTTTSFLSIAMLQQKETGTSMNSRQAYVSSKSALDIAEDFLNDGKLNLPTNIGDSKYYVFYYDASGNVQVKDFSNASDAQNFIDNTDFTVIGNAYVKITKTSDTEYTITAVGSESKYNNTNGGNTGDISAKFEVTQHLEKKELGTSLRMSEKKFSTPPAASSTGFLTLGDQTAFSLLKSQIKSTLNEERDFRTIQGMEDKGGLAYILRNEAEKTPISSFFPLVFDKALKITSSSGSRCRAIAYNNGIYLLGNYSGTDVKSSTGVDLQDICYYPNSDASYGCTLECKFLVIGGNMACKTSAGQKGAAVKYAGSDFATDKGVVIYFTKDNIICKNPNYKEAAVYNKGYYFLPIETEAINQTGIDLFDPDTPNKLTKIKDENLSTDSHYKNLNGIDKYSSLLDSNGNLKNMHSAYEEKTDSGKKTVCFLEKNGTFKTDNNTLVCTNIPKSNYYTGWEDYYTYCAPSAMPTASNKSYIDLYAGTEFNYLWYNVNQMDLNSNVNINIRSRSVVLSIGPEQGEELYYNRNKMYPYNFNQTNLPTSDFATDSGTKKTTITSSGANKIKQNDATASFNVMPYWGESSFTLTVINDFTVETANGTTYTVKAGKYTDIPQEGLNLFDDKAKDYFDSHSTEQEDSDSSGIDWVQSGTINTSVADSKLNQSSSAIKFEASNGGTLKNGAYTAKAIYCDFGNTVKGNNATLKGDAISIGANKLDGSGANNGLFINTYGGYSDSICELITKTTITKTDGTTEIQTNKTPVDGSLLHITRDTELVLDDGLTYSLNEGYYYFPNEKSDFNILSSAFWQKWTATNPYYYAKEINKDSTISYSIHNDLKTDKVSFEGKYF
ncbi:hypothetical protein [Ruminococcus sp.]|uniref:hypothetical protein n=1 Tax=Ruminococcus sp. TaxID=41978 RepID=UPI0025E8432D|nr:hypothetical protein [Ruminococcus sp.]MBD9050782.1 hypothetical protein [Ruminococcus sp.]